VGMPDQSAATGGWPDRENVHANRLQEIIEMYRAVVLAEKQQKEKDKKKQRGKYLSYTVRIFLRGDLSIFNFFYTGQDWGHGCRAPQTYWVASRYSTLSLEGQTQRARTGSCQGRSRRSA
jgi:hypothetical protein